MTEEQNQEVYENLLGVKKKSGKDPRWHAIKGLGISIGIFSGLHEKLKSIIKLNHDCKFHEAYWQKQDLWYNDKIKELGEKKERLKREVKGEV